jgi:hypothetical protein
MVSSPSSSPCARYTLYLFSFLLVSFSTTSFLYRSSPPTPSSPHLDLPSSSSGPFTLRHTYSGPTFFDGFEYEAIPDPTHGFVDYVPKQVAEQRNLTFVSKYGDRAAHVTADVRQSQPEWPGRRSVRLRSKRAYESGTVLVVDVEHQPFGCGTWRESSRARSSSRLGRASVRLTRLWTW